MFLRGPKRCDLRSESSGIFGRKTFHAEIRSLDEEGSLEGTSFVPRIQFFCPSETPNSRRGIIAARAPPETDPLDIPSRGRVTRAQSSTFHVSPSGRDVFGKTLAHPISLVPVRPQPSLPRGASSGAFIRPKKLPARYGP